MAMILGYYEVKKGLNTTDNDQLLKYLQSKIVRQHTGKLVTNLNR
jgi:hypothetical protein